MNNKSPHKAIDFIQNSSWKLEAKSSTTELAKKSELRKMLKGVSEVKKWTFVLNWKKLLIGPLY